MAATIPVARGMDHAVHKQKGRAVGLDAAPGLTVEEGPEGPTKTFRASRSGVMPLSNRCPVLSLSHS